MYLRTHLSLTAFGEFTVCLNSMNFSHERGCMSKKCTLHVCLFPLEFPWSFRFREKIFFLGALFLNLFHVVGKTDLTVRATNHAKLRLWLSLQKT